MLCIGIVDDGIGFVPTLNKLKQVLAARFVCLVEDGYFPFGDKNSAELLTAGTNAVDLLAKAGCDAVVLSSVSLSSRCFKTLAARDDVAVFGCEAPVLHASTYTASKVLVAGDAFVARAQTSQGTIPVAMPDFPALAENFDERKIVRYISDCCEKYSGQFDCIALANSSMNICKHCFSRVFPNVKIFDSLEGVARRLRKKYRKRSKDESSFCVIDGESKDISEKYSIFVE